MVNTLLQMPDPLDKNTDVINRYQPQTLFFNKRRIFNLELSTTVRNMKANPPGDDWNGAWVMDSK